MKARVNNQTWESLSDKQKEKLKEFIADRVREIESHDIANILDVFMKWCCQILHHSYGFGESRCRMFLANFYHCFSEAKEDVLAGKQMEKLDKSMEEIFKNGFPDELVKSVRQNAGIEDKEPKEL